MALYSEIPSILFCGYLLYPNSSKADRSVASTNDKHSDRLATVRETIATYLHKHPDKKRPVPKKSHLYIEGQKVSEWYFDNYKNYSYKNSYPYFSVTDMSLKKMMGLEIMDGISNSLDKNSEFFMLLDKAFTSIKKRMEETPIPDGEALTCQFTVPTDGSKYQISVRKVDEHSW